MIRSMTGYGKAETTVGRRKITVEIRSLNSKQLDLSVRMPSIFRSQDTEIRAAVSRLMQRGKVDVYINVETGDGTKSVTINEALFSAYYRQLRALADANAKEWRKGALSMFPRIRERVASEGTIIQSILRLPEVVTGETEDARQEEIEALTATLADALTHIDAFRVTEGGILMTDILGHIGTIEKLLGEVTPFEKARTEAIKTRIRENIESVGVCVDPNRLEQEMIYYVEKLDVTEEKVRLANHCTYFREVVECEDAPGRKLGFIAQEIGREINTLGSKANDASMQRIVVGMKDELEKIKEQLLNIL